MKRAASNIGSSAGTKLKVEKLGVKAGDKVVLDSVFLTSVGDAVKVGAPYVAGAKTEAKVIGAGKGKKVIVFKYHPKTRGRRRRGTCRICRLEIVKI